MREVCFQREMRDREARADPREPDRGLIDYTIEPIERDEASAFIKRYEWLGTPGFFKLTGYCARNEFNEVAAVALFGQPNVQSAGLCREITPISVADPASEDRAYFNKVVCLERGACAHWAHPHTGSWFIPRVLQRAHEDHGWEIFYAYSDEEAGEIGTIYQACNWLYLGHGTTRRKTYRVKPEPRWNFRGPGTNWQWRGSRAFYSKGLNIKEHVGIIDGVRVGPGEWERKNTIAKHKYVQFVGDKATRRKWRAALRHPPLPYPKRTQ